MIRMSLIVSLFLLSSVVYAHPPCGASYHNYGGNPTVPGQYPRARFGAGTNRCGQYGCVNGRPAMVPGRVVLPSQPSTTHIIIERK